MNADIIGTIYNNDGTYDDEGNVLTEPTSVPGYHVNFTHSVPDFSEYRCHPKTPHRVYAGHAPVCYTFPDEDKFDALYSDLFGSPDLSD